MGLLNHNELDQSRTLQHPISHVHENNDPVTINLTIDNDTTDDMPGLVLETTPEHPFYVNGTWACPECAEWVNAEDITVGTVLTSFDGEDGIIPLGTITATQRIEQEKMMYNLTVDEGHTFFVGEQGWLVHNGDGYAGPVIVHSPGATDLVAKRIHITVNGIELRVLPNHLGGLTFEQIFSGDSARDVQKQFS